MNKHPKMVFGTVRRVTEEGSYYKVEVGHSNDHYFVSKDLLKSWRNLWTGYKLPNPGEFISVVTDDDGWLAGNNSWV